MTRWMLLLAICYTGILGLSGCLATPLQPSLSTPLPLPTPLPAPPAIALPTITPASHPLPSTLPVATPISTSISASASIDIAVTPGRLLLSNSASYHITRLDSASRHYEQLEVGAAPWGIVLSPDRTLAYIATAEGVAVVDLATWQRTALIPYLTAVGAPQFGEYRPGGMGIAIAPDGSEVYVGVYASSAESRLEILDTAQQSITESFAVGLRPFQVLVSADGQRVYTIDHDSFTVTVLDLPTRTTRTLSATPLGSTSLASFDKPHYAVLDDRGHLLLPFQGQLLLDLDPESGKASTIALTANTHQHGIAWTPDRRTLLIVGTGPAGSASGPASLTLLDWASGSEEILPLSRLHEQVAVSPDGRWAYITGGHTFANGGWDGVTLIDLVDHSSREVMVPDRPLDIVVLP